MNAGLLQFFNRSDNRSLELLLEKEDGCTIDIKSDRNRRLLRSAIVFILGISIIMIVWVFVAWYYNTYMIYHLRFPTPERVFERLGVLISGEMTITESELSTHIIASLRRWIIGFTVAFIIGLAIGIILSYNDVLYEIGIVPVNILQTIPGLAWFPVCILIFGFGEEAAVFIIAITVISPIAINISSGMRKIPDTFRSLATMAGKSWWETLVTLYLPFISTDLVAGLRIGMANAWRMLISAEMVVGVVVGLGYSIDAAVGFTNFATAFACIVVICVIGVVIDKIILSPIENSVRRRMGAS